MFPFDSLGSTHRELGLMVAMAIGVGFGFVLERAGFGTAKKLSAQFYLHDMTVFKVMFSAIVTAMLGLVVLGGAGVVDLPAVLTGAASETFVWPMLVGGLVLGAGFIMSGYCPGTSLVATASGKLDGLFTIGGVVLGSVVFGLFQPMVAKYTVSGAMGQKFLDQVTGIPRPMLALIVALMAVGMFYGAEKVEAIFRRKRDLPDDDSTPARGQRARRIVFAGFTGAAILAVGTLALPGTPRAAGTTPPPKAQPPSAVRALTPAALAHRVVDAPWKLRILDVRDAKACAKKSVPGAECVPAAKLKGLNLDVVPPVRDLVLVGRGTVIAGRAVRTFRGRIYVLKGGYTAWKAYALTAPKPPAATASASAWTAYRFRAAFNASLTGRKTAPAVKAPKAFVPHRKKKRKGGCS